MAETRTDRFGLVQWGSGSDSPSRFDFNEAYANIEARAALDPGTTYSAMPSTWLVAGRYALVVPPGGESAYRTLYRRNDGGTWDYAGGNAVREPFHLRANGQARTDAALTLSHPDFAAAGGTLGYDGSALLTGTVRVHDAVDAGRGAVLVGTDTAPNLATLGRLHVRTRATAERGIVVQPYTPGGGDAGSGNLITARTAGGSDVLSVDAQGRFRAISPAAFGGGALASNHSVVLAPTSNPADSIINGLLLHGHAGADAKTMLQIYRDTSEPGPLVYVGRDNIHIGALPWGSSYSAGDVYLSANATVVRASGNAGNSVYFQVRRTDPTSAATEANYTLDTALLSVDPGNAIVRLPLTVSQRYKPDLPTLRVYRVNDFTASFVDLYRVTPDGLGGETSYLVSTWGPDGRLRTALPWRSVNTLRDSRQSVIHLANKRFAAQGSAPLTGQAVPPLTMFEYTWPQMTARSADAVDLDIVTTIELMLSSNPDGVDDAQSVLVETYVSVNGGAYNFLASSENAPVSTSAVHRQGGDLMYCNQRLANVPAGATFRIRTRFWSGGAVPTCWIRMMDLKVAEAVFEIYATA